MSSSATPSLNNKIPALTKSGSNISQHSTGPAAANTFFATEGLGQRRSGGSAPASTPRGQQSAKSKHKQSRRFRLADEDAFAESVRTEARSMSSDTPNQVQAAMQSTSSRKGQTSITHLMNFSLPPRPQHQHQHRFNNNSRTARRNPTWGLGSGYHAVDKARYVHANYRFVVDPRGDYHVQAVDADIHLDWNNILQILVSSKSQQASCPICLGDPTAPRMAKCGHIFCLPCLIRYMHSEDPAFHPNEKKPRWKKCPICEDAIYTTDTRPVRWYEGQESDMPREGSDVVLRLVRRAAAGTLAMPRETSESITKTVDVPWYFSPEVMDYARVMRGSEDYILEQFDLDISSIRQLEQEDELMFGEDSEWTGRAIRVLEEAKQKTKGIGNPPPSALKPDEPKPRKPPIEFNKDISQVPDMYSVQQATRSGVSRGETRNIETTQADASRNPSESILTTRLADFKARQNAKPPPDQYFFYQALLHYYLSPLDIRILRDAFGPYENFPSSILPRIERVSNGHIVDDELRKRIKYLAHLPYGCEVGFLECDWIDTVPPAILEKYKPELDRRRKRNTDKEAREEKERIRAEKAEDKEFAAARKRRSNHLVVDKFHDGDFQPLAPSANAGSFDRTLSVDGMTSDSGTSPLWAAHRNDGPGYTSLASPGTSPAAVRTVWGTAAVPLSSPDLRAQLMQEPVDDGWLQGWEKDLLHDEEDRRLVARIEAASLVGTSDALLTGEGSSASAQVNGASSSSAGGGKGKKKGKKITLMSTTARRGA